MQTGNLAAKIGKNDVEEVGERERLAKRLMGEAAVFLDGAREPLVAEYKDEHEALFVGFPGTSRSLSQDFTHLGRIQLAPSSDDLEVFRRFVDDNGILDDFPPAPSA